MFDRVNISFHYVFENLTVVSKASKNDHNNIKI